MRCDLRVRTTFNQGLSITLIQMNKAVHVRNDVDLVHEPARAWRSSTKAVMNFEVHQSMIMNFGIEIVISVCEGIQSANVEQRLQLDHNT